MSKTLYLSPPSFDGFDGGAGARYQARREVTSYWYPTWLAQPAALTPNSRLLDCPPHDIDLAKCLAIAKELARREILVDYRPQAGVRVAPHFYTTDEEVEHTVKQLCQIAFAVRP